MIFWEKELFRWPKIQKIPFRLTITRRECNWRARNRLQGLHLRRLRQGVRDQVAAEDAQEEHPPEDQGPGVPGVRLLMLGARQPQDSHQGGAPKAQGHCLR